MDTRVFTSALVVVLALLWTACSGTDSSSDTAEPGDTLTTGDTAQCHYSCEGKECGDDGCGGSCGSCFTPGGAVDNSLCVAGTCQCEPQCAGRECGPDGCGGTCGNCFGSGGGLDNTLCSPLGQCEGGCAPACGGKTCGDDGCGGSCGSCADGQDCVQGQCTTPPAEGCGVCPDGTECGVIEEYPYVCAGEGCGGGLDMVGECVGSGSNTTVWCDDGWTYAIDCDYVDSEWTCGWDNEYEYYACVSPCAPDCSGKECGDDGCGGSCGTCTGGLVCSGGQCVSDCNPSCVGKQCGDDGCGGTCGSCNADQSCSNGTCVDNCTPACAGKECGDDGCGGFCGSCGGGQLCNNGQCIDNCSPSCAGKECGSDGCGGTCGSCPGGSSCNNGQCSCVPNCLNKQCGPDGCGGSCGTCLPGSNCNNGKCSCTQGTIRLKNNMTEHTQYCWDAGQNYTQYPFAWVETWDTWIEGGDYHDVTYPMGTSYNFKVQCCLLDACGGDLTCNGLPFPWGGGMPCFCVEVNAWFKIDKCGIEELVVCQ